MSAPETREYTERYEGPVGVLATTVQLAPAFRPEVGESPRCKDYFRAIWDTGATYTVITQGVVDRLGLEATGKATTHTAQGPFPTETYLVNIGLKNNVGIAMLTVLKGNPAPGIDVILGLDVIRRGTFTVATESETTTLTFSMATPGAG